MKINTGESNIVADWQRLNWDNAFINGQPIRELMEMKGIHQETLTEGQLRSFFSDTILWDLPEENKPQAVNYLMTSFHQGGLLHPVSASMYHVFNGSGIGPSAKAEDNDKQVNILTTPTGFKIQEIYTVKKFTLDPNAEDDLLEKYDNGRIEPDKGNDFCVKAQATLNVSFKEGKERIDMTSAHISYGNDHIQSIADKRGWFTKFVDYMKNLFNANTAKDLSIKDDDKLTKEHKSGMKDEQEDKDAITHRMGS
ncbi:hypothetical protein [Legionella impletisoli]|uniref:hypothetical protein n=1 Tax=Legionella impletisoli TaxID=343510 RepID=UPI001041707C|nr:hypothetical protein [Legionella impletisoli]